MKSRKHPLPPGSNRPDQTSFWSALMALMDLRAIKVGVASGALAFLAACGGGGSGTPDLTPPVAEPPAPTPTARILSVADRPAIPAEADRTTAAVQVEVDSGATGVALQGANGPMPVGSSGTYHVDVVGVDEQTVRLLQGDTVLAAVLVLPSCDSPAEWNGEKCAVPVAPPPSDDPPVDPPPVDPPPPPPPGEDPPTDPPPGDEPPVPALVYYTRANFVIDGEVIWETGNGTGAIAYPQLIVGLERIPLKNETGFQVGSCMLSSRPLGPEAGVLEGLPAANCTKPRDGNVRAIFPMDPVARVLLPAYEGELPADLVWRGGAYSEFGDSPYAAYGVSRKGYFIDVEGGIYYTPGINPNELRFTSDLFLTYQVLQSEWTVILLMTYTNPAPSGN